MGPGRTVDGVGVAAPGRVLARAALALPDQFLAGPAPLGVEVAAAMKLPDHHRFQRAELDRFVARASADGLVAMVTTAKDAMRIEPFLPLPIPVLVVPLSVTVHPAEEFSRWLASRLGLE
jgi:tetraacyldisaccharide-1-P 4'-kinase